MLALHHLTAIFASLFCASIVLSAPADVEVRSSEHGSHARLFNVRDFGAVGNGSTKDTAAINKAVDACAAGGGGVVFLPPGDYLSGAINLKSHVTLYIGAGATIIASEEVADYPLVETPWPGYPDTDEPNVGPYQRRVVSSVINGDGLENVAIAGPGAVDGRGQIWWRRVTLFRDYARKRITEPIPGKEEEFAETKKVHRCLC